MLNAQLKIKLKTTGLTNAEYEKLQELQRQMPEKELPEYCYSK